MDIENSNNKIILQKPPLEGRLEGSFPSYYLPPISWFSSIKSGEPVLIEVCENFIKQTERNRCYIDSPNGRLALSIPIDKSNFSDKGKCLMRDVMISRQLNWQHQHWQAFETSYFNSPFFEYLQDDFRPIYINKEWKYLIDLNDALLEVCLNLLELDCPILHTTVFSGERRKERGESSENTPPSGAGGLSGGLSGGLYYQTYRHKHPFLPDLSIFDLLMNMGPEAPLYTLNPQPKCLVNSK